jgi:hypothetical protein
MRPEAENGPSAHSRSGRNLGLGQESRVLPGPRLGPLDVSHPSASDGQARIPAEQNRLQRPRANPRVHLRLLAPRRAPQPAVAHPAMAPPRAVSPAHAPADGWTRHRRAAPRQSRTRVDLGGCDSSVDERRGGGWHRRGPLADAHARRWADAPPSSSSSVGPYPHSHGGSRARCSEQRLEIYPRGSQILSRRWFTRGEVSSSI